MRSLVLVLSLGVLLACDAPPLGAPADAPPSAAKGGEKGPPDGKGGGGGSENEAPTADPGGPYTGIAGEPVAFDGTGSTDPDGPDGKLTYRWEFGDGATGEGDRPSHGYAEAGEYVVTLVVRDRDGLESAPATTTASISEPQTGGEEPSPAGTECESPDPAWIWCDDFELDRLDAYFEYNSSGESFVRASGVGVDGSYGMRARFGEGQVSAGWLHLAFGRTPQAYFRPVDDGTADYREVYWRLYVRNEPEWTGGGGKKLSRATSFASSTSWAQAMIAHVWSGGDSDHYLVIDPASGTDEEGNLQTTKYNDFENLRWLGARRGTTPLFDASHVGAWYCVEARVRWNDPEQANGVFELWIDGNLDAGRDDLNWVGSYDDYGINAVFVENYWNDGSPRAQERYFDNLIVSTERIGC